jgi:hypothetical protein
LISVTTPARKTISAAVALLEWDLLVEYS